MTTGIDSAAARATRAGGDGRRYAIVTPVRNEASVIARTLDSVIAQTVPPAVWVIVDDGSTDGTAAIVEDFTREAPFIDVLQLHDGGTHDTGGDRLRWAAEAIAFNAGLARLDLARLDYVVKLDGDLAFGPRYFEELLAEFDRDPSLGIAGGECYALYGDRRELEWVPESHVRGATKMYRRDCFIQIGGISPVYGWDTLDELRAQMKGWRTRSFAYPLDHLRPTGSKGGQLKGQARMGRGAYLLGYHPAFLLARAAKLTFTRPYVLSGCAFLGGYLAAVWERPVRTADADTVAYLRAQQMGRLRSFGNLVEIRSLFGRGAR